MGIIAGITDSLIQSMTTFLGVSGDINEYRASRWFHLEEYTWTWSRDYHRVPPIKGSPIREPERNSHGARERFVLFAGNECSTANTACCFKIDGLGPALALTTW
jgi:hypothetical protein